MPLHVRRPLVYLLLLVPLPLAAQQRATPGGGAGKVRIDYVEDSLPNGLKVLYHVDRAAPIVAVNLWYDVGSKHEEPGRTGFAHLFEHMMFKGSKNVGDGQHFALLERAGGRAGADINGTTNGDRTNYFEQVPSNQLELALWLEADRMGTLLETLTKEKLDNQREVVKNERRQGVDNQPYGTWFEKMLFLAYPPEHPYHHTTIGSMRDLTLASEEDVKAFFRTYYAPNNAVLVIAGDVDVAQAKALVRKHFADIARGPEAPPLQEMTLPPLVGAEQRAVLDEKHAPAPAVYVGFRAPAQKDSLARVVDFLGDVIGSGQSSRLYKALVREQQVATNVFGFNFGFVDGADLLVFGAIGKPGANPDSLERALLAELDRAKEGFRQEELDRVRAVARFGFVNGLQFMGGFGGRADRLAEGWTYYRDPNWVNGILDEYDRVTLAQLDALARERLVPRNRVTLVFVPTRPSTTAAAEVVP
jgi:predicted Zn-dependent peptidase